MLRGRRLRLALLAAAILATGGGVAGYVVTRPPGDISNPDVAFDESEPGLIRLYCTILVDRESQKPIVVGKAGSMIKAIGTAARLGLEEHFGQRVFLDLHVKARSEWRDDERLLDEIGLHGR